MLKKLTPWKIRPQTNNFSLFLLDPSVIPVYDFKLNKCHVTNKAEEKKVNELQDEWEGKKGCPFWRQTQVTAH